MKLYSVGFILDKSLKKVLLIHKLNPAWQRGLVNGIGGKIEPGEDALSCMVRETLEESGLKTDKSLWTFLGIIESANWRVDVFSYKYSGKLQDARTCGKEKIEWFDSDKLPVNVVTNLKWLIPYAMDHINDTELNTFRVSYFEGLKS